MANQAALQTAGNNIANVNVAGYSRQKVVMSNVPEYLGTEFGKRLHSQAVGEQVRTTHALAFGNDMNQIKKYRNMVWEAAEELNRRGNSVPLAELREIEEARKKV